MVNLGLRQKFISILPKSTFGQTALLIAALLFINQLVSYLSVTHYFISPSYKQINKLISNQINTFFILDIESLSPAQIEKLTSTTGIRFHDEISAMHAGLGNAAYYDFMSKQITQQLGKDTEIRVKTGKNYMVWIKPPQDRDLWISIPLTGPNENSLSPLTMYFFVIGALSVTGGWLFVQRLNRPLQALQKGARQVEKGHFPAPLALVGSSEIIAVTEAFNKMSRGIKQLENDRVLMTAGISHDLRTPLTRIRLASEMLPDEQAWVKDGIEHDIEDLNAIINQFIDYAKQDQQETAVFANINELIHELVDSRTIISTHMIELKLAKVTATKLRTVGIKRVIENLIENALKYGSDTITISTAMVDKNRNILCCVRDFGKGIDQTQMEQMFTPFAQGDQARGTSGSGLGLAIVKRIIESHGGKIQFTNHPDGGLNASFLLPVSH